MIRRLVVSLVTAFALLSVGARAEAGFWKLRGATGAPAIALVTPGGGWSGFLSQPARQGSSGDYGYADQAIARFDAVPYQTLGSGQTLNVGVIAYHQTTATEYAAGKTSNIDHVDFQAEGGAITTVTSPIVNPTTGATEYTVALRASDFSDGPHELRAVVYPVTGTPLVLQGPPGGNSYRTCTISGTTLSCDSLSSAAIIQAGQTVMCIGCADGTQIVSGSGATWTVSISQTVSSQPMDFDGASGLPFTTNNGSSLPAGIRYASTTGTDTTGCGVTSSSPCLTPTKGLVDLATAQSGDAGGGFVCVQAGTYTYGTSGDQPKNAASRWPTVQPSGVAPCDSVNAGSVFFSGNGSTAGLRIAKIHVKGITFSGDPPGTTNQAQGDPMIWLDGVTFTGRGLTIPNNGGAFVGGWYYTDSTVTNTQTGAVSAQLVRNTNVSVLAADAFSSSRLVVNSSAKNMSALLATGNIALTSNVVTNVSDTSKMQVGGYVNTGAPAAQFPAGTTLLGIGLDGPNTIRLSANALSTVTGAQLWAGASSGATNSHGDVWQITGIGTNLIAQNLQAGDCSNFAQQVFADGSSPIKGMAIVNSSFCASSGWTALGGLAMQLNSQATNLLWNDLSWGGNLLWRSTTTDVLLQNNACTGSGPGTNAGVTYRGSTCH